MKFTRRSAVIATVAALVAVLGIGQAVLRNKADARGRTVEAPKFEVGRLWPRPIPNHWVFGMVIGVWVDDQDHVWVVHRGAATLHNNERALDLNVGECCTAAPPVVI